MADALKQTTDTVGKTAQSATNTLGDTVKSAGDTAGNTAKDTKEGAKGTFSFFLDVLESWSVRLCLVWKMEGEKGRREDLLVLLCEGERGGGGMNE
jgi:hypothetical protein